MARQRKKIEKKKTLRRPKRKKVKRKKKVFSGYYFDGKKMELLYV